MYNKGAFCTCDIPTVMHICVRVAMGRGEGLLGRCKDPPNCCLALLNGNVQCVLGKMCTHGEFNVHTELGARAPHISHRLQFAIFFILQAGTRGGGARWEHGD